MSRVEFGFVAAAADRAGTSDADLYQTLLSDVDYHAGLGFTTAWIIEHHFSDYFPTPNPLLLLGHVAARRPELSLGTCVLVTPWYDPLRLAEDIATVSLLTDGQMHLGLGRGTAKYEYDAFGINMDESRDRFRETYEILTRALSGEYFSYTGKYLTVPKKIRVRPRVAGVSSDRIHLYGAIGTPGTAGVMAEMGLPPICTSLGDLNIQRRILDNWRQSTSALGHNADRTFPMMVNCIIADTDAQAIALAQEYMPRFMQAQVDHYTPDETDWENLPSYAGWKAQFESMKAKTNPANIPKWTEGQLVGSPDTVIRKTREFIDAGFNHLLLHTATPGVPHQVRREWASRFAHEVAPEFASVLSGHLPAADH